MNEWNIQSRAHACQACQKAFADKEVYHTILCAERTELLRQDICKACWDSQFNLEAQRKGFISLWQGIYQAPPAAPPEPIQKETAETLLRKLIELNEPKYGPACFILAVMLERKRLLKVKEQLKRDGVRVFVYEQPKTGDLFTITDPDLQLNQLDEVQHTVAALLEHGIESLAPTPASAPAATSEAVAPDSTTEDAASLPPESAAEGPVVADSTLPQEPEAEPAVAAETALVTPADPPTDSTPPAIN